MRSICNFWSLHWNGKLSWSQFCRRDDNLWRGQLRKSWHESPFSVWQEVDITRLKMEIVDYTRQNTLMSPLSRGTHGVDMASQKARMFSLIMSTSWPPETSCALTIRHPHCNIYHGKFKWADPIKVPFLRTSKYVQTCILRSHVPLVHYPYHKVIKQLDTGDCGHSRTINTTGMGKYACQRKRVVIIAMIMCTYDPKSMSLRLIRIDTYFYSPIFSPVKKMSEWSRGSRKL